MKYNLNKKLLALAISGILSANAHAAITDIIITEYVEGDDFDTQAIELTNTGNESYTFPSDIYLQYTDGNFVNNVLAATTEDASVLNGVTIDANSTIVVIDGSAGEDLTGAIDASVTVIKSVIFNEKRFSNLGFSGDDSVSLINITDNTVYDIIGEAGTNWGNDKTFRRRLIAENESSEVGLIPTQSSTYDKTNWEVFALGTFDDLGKATYSPIYVEPDIITTTISEIQGSGTFSPLITSGFSSTDEYDVTGIVTAVTTFPDDGFFLQDITPDNDPLTSDGIFVSTTLATDDMIGKTINLTSIVEEQFGVTRLSANTWVVIDETSSVPAATDIKMIEADGGSFHATLERHEGMLVNLPKDIDADTAGNQDMRVTKLYSTNFEKFFRDDMFLSYQRPNFNPTQVGVAGSPEAIAAAAENNDYTLVIESGSQVDAGYIPYYPDYFSDPENNYIRIDDSVIGMEGVITYAFDDYNLVVTNELSASNFEHNTDRRSSPPLDTTTEDSHFAIKIGTQNVLNLFNSPYGGDTNLHGDNRGAVTEAEYEKQLEKIVDAIVKLDADIVGLMEIENNGFGSNGAIQTLVDAINVNYDADRVDEEDDSDSTSNQYVFVGYDSNNDLILNEEDSIGYDVITTGLIYRPSKVSLESMRIISMPEQHAPVIVNENNVIVKDYTGAILESGDNFQRETLAPTFKINNTGKTLTVAVNHFKSKGSTCWEEWDGFDFGDTTEVAFGFDAPDEDLQGNCDNFRVSAAVQLGKELDKIGGDRVIIGDLNSYGLEDSLLVLTENLTGKEITSARDTFIGDKPQFNVSGAPQTITKSYGYINAISLKDEEKGQSSWSYSFGDQIGSLDHILISPSMQDRLIDATDWHINAGESTLLDFESERKDGNEDNFYVPDLYRSSDHDPAIMSLSYEYAEVGEGEPVLLQISNSLVSIPYVLAEGTLAGDVAQISLSSENDMSGIVLPAVTLTNDNQLLTELEINGLETGTYTARLTLTRDNGVVSNYTKTVDFIVSKQDSTIAKVAPVEEYDGSGGSFGFFSLLSLLGLGFLRRSKTNA